MVSRIAGVLGELLITFAVIIALFVFYQLYWTGLATGRAQSQAADDLRSQWGEVDVAAEGERAAAGEPDASLDPAMAGYGEGWGTHGAPVAYLTAQKAGIDEFVAFEGVEHAPPDRPRCAGRRRAEGSRVNVPGFVACARVVML